MRSKVSRTALFSLFGALLLQSCLSDTTTTTTRSITLHIRYPKNQIDSVVTFTAPRGILAWVYTNAQNYTTVAYSLTADTTLGPCSCESASSPSLDTCTVGMNTVTHWGCGWDSITFERWAPADPSHTWQVTLPPSSVPPMLQPPTALGGHIDNCVVGDIVPVVMPSSMPMHVTRTTLGMVDHFVCVSSANDSLLLTLVP